MTDLNRPKWGGVKIQLAPCAAEDGFTFTRRWDHQEAWGRARHEDKLRIRASRARGWTVEVSAMRHLQLKGSNLPSSNKGEVWMTTVKAIVGDDETSGRDEVLLGREKTCQYDHESGRKTTGSRWEAGSRKYLTWWARPEDRKKTGWFTHKEPLMMPDQRQKAGQADDEDSRWGCGRKVE